MPGGDKTGPMGMGPMTGRGAGYCAGFNAPGFVNRPAGGGFGMGAGRGRGFRAGGRGWRQGFNATGVPGGRWFGGNAAPEAYPTPYGNPDPEMEKRALKQHADALRSELDIINKRLGEIGADTPSE